MNIDERLEAITMNLEILSRDVHELQATVHDLQATVHDLKTAVQIDAENIRALAGIARTTHDSIKGLENIATAHGQRLDQLENR